MQKLEMICPPWTLPKEDIPIHVKIDKSVTPKIKQAVITMPNSMTLRDTINIARHNYADKQLIIHECEQASGSDFDYFGFVVATTELPKELKRKVPLRIVFQYKDGTAEEHYVHVKIFRPKLEFDSTPSKLTITSKNNKTVTLPVNVKFSGFGHIVIQVECSIQGQVVSINDSILEDVLRTVDAKILHTANVDTNTESYVEHVRILSDELRKFIDSEDVRRMLIGGATIDELSDLFQNIKIQDREKFLNLCYKTIEEYLLRNITDIMEKNPSNNVELESRTKIRTLLNMDPLHLVVKLTYKDTLGNRYSPIVQNVEIINADKKLSGPVEIPLTIKSNESGAFKDVDV